MRRLCGRRDSQKACSLLIIVVPASEGPPVSQWRDASGSWLSKLSDDVPQAEFWEYPLTSIETPFPAQAFQDEAHNLLELLRGLHIAITAVWNVPIVIFTTGTGGLIVKRAVSLLDEKSYLANWRRLLRSLAAIVFLGVPHIMFDQRQAKITLEQLLRCTTRSNMSLANADATAITIICNDFSNSIDSNEALSIKILSVYETQGVIFARNTFTNVLSRFWGPKKRAVIIIPKELCVTRGRDERLLAFDSSHLDICKLSVHEYIYDTIYAIVKTVSMKHVEPVEPVSLSDINPWESTISLASQVRRDDADRQTGIGGATIGKHDIIAPLELIASPIWDDNPRTKVQLPCFSSSTPSRIVPFHGRQDTLSRIDYLLLPPNAVIDESEPSYVRNIALCGVGGIGKTSIAIEYAHTRREAFDAIFWVNAHNTSTIAKDLSSIAEQLGVVSDPADLLNPVVIRDLFQGWLAEPRRTHNGQSSYANWLLILDGVDRINSLPDYWPGTGRGAVLITTRDQSANHGMLCKNYCEVEPFNQQESSDLISDLNVANSELDSSVTDLAELLGGIPLAIVQVAADIRRQQLSGAEFVSYLKHSQARFGTDIVELWGLNTLDGATRSLLEVIALLDPHTPTKRLLRVNNPTEPLNYVKAVEALLSLSLIYVDEMAEEIRMSWLVRDRIRKSISTDELRAATDSATSLLRRSWTAQIIGLDELLPSLSALLPNIMRFAPELTTIDHEFYLFLQEALRQSRTGPILPGASTIDDLQNLLSMLERSPEATIGIAPEHYFGDLSLGNSIGGFEMGAVEPDRKFDAAEETSDHRDQYMDEMSIKSVIEDLVSPESSSSDGASERDSPTLDDNVEATDRFLLTDKRNLNLAQAWSFVLTTMGIIEPPLARRKQRLRWQCACGHRGFDDVEEGVPNGSQYLKDRIEAESDVKVALSSNARTGYRWPSGNVATRACHSAWISIHGWATSTGSTRPQHQSSALPQHNPATLNLAQIQQRPTPAPNPLLLLSCVRRGRGKQLFQDDVKQLSNDKQLIYFLKAVYKTHRSRSKSIFSLRDVQSIALVKFQLLLGGTVATRHHQTYCRTQNCECLPPMYLIFSSNQAQPEYKCDPVPADTEPPIPPELFWHLFTEPECVKDAQKWILAQVPKRTKDQLEGDASKPVFGWGVEFQESWSPIKVTILILGGFVLSSIVFGVVWTVMKKDLQGAFGVSSWLITLGAILLTLIVIHKSDL